MKAAVIVFPGSNRDGDALHVCNKVMGWEAVGVWHESHSLGSPDLVILPGGFAYGDYLRCGAIARFSPVMEAVAKHAQGGGLTLRFGLPRASQFAGLAVLSGAFREPDGFAAGLPEDRAIPIFIAHGLYDPMVTVQRGQETLSFLEGAGYKPEYHQYEMAHEVSEEVIFDLTPWLHNVLPPAPSL